MYTLKTFIKKEKIESDYIVVGVSSGPDSMALLHYLKEHFPKKIVCAHINHNIRLESQKEEEYLKKYCEKKEIIFESTKIEEYKENNFENEARKKRYAFFEEILAKYNSKYLFLAHHGDDLIETVIMKIIRGSNIEGYCGIKQISKRKNYYILRPLLNYTKDNLIIYCENHNIKYFNDSSNNSAKYTRNRIRKYILPILKKETPNIHHQFLKYSKSLLEYIEYIDKITSDKIKNIYKDNIININEFKKEDYFIQKNIIYKILIDIYNNKENIIKEKHLTNIISIIENEKPNLIVNLPLNKIAIKEYDKLIFKNYLAKRKNYKIQLEKYNIIDNHIITYIDKTLTNGNDIIKLNSKKIELPLFLRNKQDGDYITLKGTGNKKKISDIFIDEKIPLSKRNTYPLLVDSKDNILWIPNLKKSIFDESNLEKYDIILRYYEKENFNEQENS